MFCFVWEPFLTHYFAVYIPIKACSRGFDIEDSLLGDSKCYYALPCIGHHDKVGKGGSYDHVNLFYVDSYGNHINSLYLKEDQNKVANYRRKEK